MSKAQRAVYYLRMVMAVVLSPMRPISNLFWLLRWAYTVAVMVTAAGVVAKYVVLLLAAIAPGATR